MCVPAVSSSSCVLYSVYTQYNDLNAFIVMYCSVLLCICLYCCVLLCIVGDQVFCLLTRVMAQSKGLGLVKKVEGVKRRERFAR